MPASSKLAPGGVWHLRAVQASALWTRSDGDGVHVAVLDAGTKTSRALPAARVTTLDHLGSPSTTYHGSHGTACAGIIGSEMRHCPGVAPRVRVSSYRVTLSANQIHPPHVESAFAAAMRDGCDVISCSFVIPAVSPDLRDVVGRAIARGVVVVAASGNDPNRCAEFPESFPGLVCVAATGPAGNGQRPIASQRLTPRTDVFAPGNGLRVLQTSGGHGSWAGQTSGAAAVVAGVVACIVGAIPAKKRRRIGLALDGLLAATADSMPWAGAPNGRARILNPTRALDAACSLAATL